MTSENFARLGVPAHLADALAPQGIVNPTPIQAATLPDALAGRDVLGKGRTGSGKTFAFLLPLVARLEKERRRPAAKRPRALILAPTRELATQIHESLQPLARAARLSSVTIFGGVGQGPQVTSLARGIDIAVACPGRLLDLMGQGHVNLADVSVTVLDEADHMADMGFLPMVRRILDTIPETGQRLLFSATLDQGVGTIVGRYLHSPVTHETDSTSAPVGKMDHHVLEVSKDDRFPVLLDIACAPGRTIMFTRTKHGAKGLTRKLVARGVDAVELHGNLSQGARRRNLDAFSDGSASVLVCTDIAARGIHVDEVALVVHADPPVEHKAYLHRSGRTARAGESGTVLTVQTPEQRQDVRSLMRAARIHPTVHEHVTPSSAVLQELVPGERIVPTAPVAGLEQMESRGGGRSAGGQGRGRSRGRGGNGGGQAGGRGGQGGGRGGNAGGRGGQGGRPDGSGRGERSGSGRGGNGGRGERTGAGRGESQDRRSSGGRSRSGRGRGSSGRAAVYTSSSSDSGRSGGGLASFSAGRSR